MRTADSSRLQQQAEETRREEKDVHLDADGERVEETAGRPAVSDEQEERGVEEEPGRTRDTEGGG